MHGNQRKTGTCLYKNVDGSLEQEVPTWAEGVNMITVLGNAERTQKDQVWALPVRVPRVLKQNPPKGQRCDMYTESSTNGYNIIRT